MLYYDEYPAIRKGFDKIFEKYGLYYEFGASLELQLLLHLRKEQGDGRNKICDVFIYVPSVREIVRIAEGNGTNLLDEDEAEGYVDYIYYDQHELSSGMPECDGGQVMLTELFRDKFSSTEDAIPAVLDMAYGNKNLKYVILGDGGITCKV